MKAKTSSTSGLAIALCRAWERFKRTLHLLGLQRERAALETRRDQYLHRLGQKAYAEMKAKGPDMLPSAGEVYMDVRAVQSRLDEVERQMAALREPVPAPTPRVTPGPLSEASLPTTNAPLTACPCGAMLPAGARFCPECGMPAGTSMPSPDGRPARRQPQQKDGPRRTCPRCGGFVPLMTDYCPTCQAPAVSWTLDEE